MKIFFIVGLAALLSFSTVIVAQERLGTVTFSDGTSDSGTLSLTPGSQLRIQSGKSLRLLGLDLITVLQLSPDRKIMQRAERISTTEVNKMEYYGEPYPILYFTATATLSSGEKISGYLATTMLYVSTADDVKKVLLPVQIKGKEGQKYEEVIYPSTITFNGSAVQSAAKIHLQLSKLSANTEVVGLTYGELGVLEAKPLKTPGHYEMTSPLDKRFFIAEKSGSKIIVGWPPTSDEKWMSLVRNSLNVPNEFFDDRQLLGVFQETPGGDLYSLILSTRNGDSYKNKKPWRLEIYRWKQSDDGRLLLAVRGLFFRDLSDGDKNLPSVELSPDLWSLHQQGDLWTDTHDE